MIIGVDLDNTIVCYDGLFHRVALARQWIPAGLANDKQSVRDYLRGAGRHDEWTILQGMVYGDEMIHAEPFPGAQEFFAEARRRDWDICIVSHRTRKPYLGPETDLHQAARRWLARNGFTADTTAGGSGPPVFLEETLESKLHRIRELGCDVFVDDLPELLQRPDFPGHVRRICFDPRANCDKSGLERLGSWDELERLLDEDER